MILLEVMIELVCIAAILTLSLLLINVIKRRKAMERDPIIKKMEMVDAKFVEINIEDSPLKPLSLEQQFPKLKAYH